VSIFFNTMSVVFPLGEQFFIDSVRSKKEGSLYCIKLPQYQNSNELTP